MTDARKEWKKLFWIAAAFLALFWLPVHWQRFAPAVLEALRLARWYAREHVLLCLVPAFFIAGAIGVFVSHGSVMKYLGARANRALAYGVAAVSGSILAVCSCTVLPLFAGIYRMGAGLGPAVAFLYSGPAINVLAIILTARILGIELGIARAVGAVGFAIVIGLAMHLIYRKEERSKADGQLAMPVDEPARPLWQNAAFFAVMIGVLVFANWGAPGTWRYEMPDGTIRTVDVVHAPFEAAEPDAAYTLRTAGAGQPKEFEAPAGRFLARRQPLGGPWSALWRHKWSVTAGLAGAFGLVLILWFRAAWWKVLLAAAAPAALALALPTHGLWVLLPFAAAVAGLSAVLATSGGEARAWLEQTWGFAKQILPLLLIGVLAAGFLLGRPSHPALIPSRYVEMLLGDRPDRFLEITGWTGAAGAVRFLWPLWTNLFASVFGAFMYFATLTEVPILQGLIGAGMGKGPALALLLAGPALSLPNMLVIASVLGVRKTLVFVGLVVTAATAAGMIYGGVF